MMRRHGNTGREMVASGQWVKVGRKHYRHESGIEITFNWNTNRWVVSNQPTFEWSSLWVARHEALIYDLLVTRSEGVVT